MGKCRRTVIFTRNASSSGFPTSRVGTTCDDEGVPEIGPLSTPSRRLRPLEDFLDAIFAPVRPIAEAASAASARFGAWYTDNEDAILEALQTLTFVGVAAIRPENWQKLQTPELMRLHRIAIADQMCLVWVPRAATVRELLKSPDREQRRLLLVARRGKILDDCEAAITASSEFESKVHADICRLALKSVLAARDEHDEAAQALAGSVLSSVIHEMLGFDSQGAARRQFEQTCSDAELRLFMLREAVLFGATARVFAKTSEGLPGFNRHATAHGQLNSFGPADMLEAIMLASAWLRETAFQHAQMQLHDHPKIGVLPNGSRQV
jgi:hypothetical protein